MLILPPYYFSIGLWEYEFHGEVLVYVQVETCLSTMLVLNKR